MEPEDGTNHEGSRPGEGDGDVQQGTASRGLALQGVEQATGHVIGRQEMQERDQEPLLLCRRFHFTPTSDEREARDEHFVDDVNDAVISSPFGSYDMGTVDLNALQQGGGDGVFHDIAVGIRSVSQLLVTGFL